jgi:hypothetical protein
VTGRRGRADSGRASPFLGQSLAQPTSVNTILGQIIPPTLSLLAGEMVLWLTAGDLLVVTATVLATVVLFAVINLIADVCFALLNPRVRVT